MTLIFKPQMVIEFIGDSITDCYRLAPAYTPLGSGYVHEIHRLLQAGYPELKLTVINRGISGDRVTDLAERWDSDAVKIAPDWLFIYIGINDVWRSFEGPLEEAVSLPDFINTYQHLIDETQNKLPNTHIRLVSPFLGEKDQSDPFRRKLSDYQSSIDEIGEVYSIPVIHLQPAFDWAMLSKPDALWTVDRVHPTSEGHMLIALTILRTCGFVF